MYLYSIILLYMFMYIFIVSRTLVLIRLLMKMMIIIIIIIIQFSSTCRTLPYRVHQFLIRVHMKYVLQALEVKSILSNIDSNFVPLLHKEWKEKWFSSTAVEVKTFNNNNKELFLAHMEKKLIDSTTLKHN